MSELGRAEAWGPGYPGEASSCSEFLIISKCQPILLVSPAQGAQGGAVTVSRPQASERKLGLGPGHLGSVLTWIFQGHLNSHGRSEELVSFSLEMRKPEPRDSW